MKFTTLRFIAVIMTITISFTSANKLSASALTLGGGGNWNDGYLCPKIFINNKDQGEAKIFAKEITQPNGENTYGMTFAFSQAPKDDMIKKVGLDLGSNKFRIAYRKMLNNFKYVNPWGNKYIEGTVQDEAGVQYPFKILLPYKTFGWYINDTEGNKIAASMNSHSTLRTSSVVSSKYTLRTNYQSYFDAKKSFDAISKNKKAYEDHVNAKKAKLTELSGQIEGLKTKAVEAGKNENNKRIELLEAQAILDDLLKKETSIAGEMTAINESTESLKKEKDDVTKIKEQLTKIVEDTKTAINAEYVKLVKYAPQRTADINQSKTDLFAEHKDGYISNLNKVYS